MQEARMGPPEYIVDVREYDRVREGQHEKVRRHKRRPRRWFRRPRP
jgi:hypothetical protein